MHLMYHALTTWRIVTSKSKTSQESEIHVKHLRGRESYALYYDLTKTMPKINVKEVIIRVDEHGEPCHNSMYKHLWSNAIKEGMEYPDYTFEQHFGKNTPSFPPRSAVRDYLEGRFANGTHTNLKRFNKFNTAVRFVKFCDEKDEFAVTVNNLETAETSEEIFSQVVVATGIFSTPKMPEVNGISSFEGRILHAHDFRDAREFIGQRVLLIGAGYSGEDIALQLVKFGAKRVILSYRTNPRSHECKLPEDIEERPMVERFDSHKAYFKDQSSANIDAVIFTTGYKNYFPFLEGRFRIPEETHLYPEGLYKAALYFKAGNNRLFYVGAQDQFSTFIKFEAIANWTVKFIMGQFKDEPVSQDKMKADSDVWHKRFSAVTCEEEVANTDLDLVGHLAALGQYDIEIEIEKIRPLFLEWTRIRKDTLGLAKYRDVCFKNVYSDKLGVAQTPFMKNFDDSIGGYVNCKPYI